MSASVPTDVHALLQWNMIHAHNTFKAGYKNIITHLDNPPTNDLDNFLFYLQSWATAIHDHHDVEEEIVFPFLNTKLDFSEEKHQHEIILTALDQFSSYIKSASADHSKFDGQELKAMMEGFNDELTKHLDEEVAHLSPATLACFSEKEILDFDKKFNAHVKSHGDPFILVPYMRSHTPANVKAFWPMGLPWVLRNVVVPVLALRHRGAWKYSVYTMS